MKKLLILVVLMATFGLNALEKAETPDINYETLQIEKLVAKLKNNQSLGNRLLTAHDSTLQKGIDKIKLKAQEIQRAVKNKLPQSSIDKLKADFKDMKNKFDAQIEKLK